MCEGLRQITALPDPVGEMDEFRTRENGLQIGKMRVPLGVSASFTNPDPTVTADCRRPLPQIRANACVLRRAADESLQQQYGAPPKLITQAVS